MEINNRKAYHEYEIIDTYEAGIVLVGTEVKSIKNGKANFQDSYIIIRGEEAYILNMHISPYEQGNIFNHDETRTRKLLLHKKEINKLKNKVTLEGLTIIPLKLYFVKNKAKILIALAKGKKLYDKREAMKEKDQQREMRKDIKYKNR
jgi:SsrA-binding protein